MDEETTICVACSATLASSGAIRKYLVRTLGFNVIPTSPPETFIDRLTCSRGLFLEAPGNYRVRLDVLFSIPDGSFKRFENKTVKL